VQLLTEDQTAVREVCRQVLNAHSTSARIRAVAASASGHDPELWQKTAELGWTALAVPAASGGLGGSACDLALVAEEYGRALQPSLLTNTLAASWVLGRHTSSAAARDLFDEIGEGTAVVSWGLGEPETGDSLNAETSSGGRRLLGRRDFVPDGQCATHVLVAVRNGCDEQVAIVPTSAAGVSLTSMATMDITRRYSRLTIEAGAPSESWFVPTDGCLSESLRRLGTVLQCAESTGVAAKLLAMTVDYVGQRRQFGQLIGSFQAIKHRIADMLIEVEGCRVATREAAEAVDAGGDSAEAVSVAKSWVGRAASLVASQALQIHGGIGFTWEHDLHLYLRRAKVNELLLGTPEWHDMYLSQVLQPLVSSTASSTRMCGRLGHVAYGTSEGRVVVE
jgi:alkylation response protein AidB-like acyl-CoA dehydrogenase